jgi:hypothetical protein
MQNLGQRESISQETTAIYSRRINEPQPKKPRVFIKRSIEPWVCEIAI